MNQKSQKEKHLSNVNSNRQFKSNGKSDDMLQMTRRLLSNNPYSNKVYVQEAAPKTSKNNDLLEKCFSQDKPQKKEDIIITNEASQELTQPTMINFQRTKS